ncbi:MAG: bifunctional UDP-N-acetylglucosamine diphosphorylase/glucosamine-1-phosphate N-acetyltransferase GlmU [Proteobacteria bacterium]|nr:bifunctional UDP-N-acetylglucosamine diphosphorylase/glucosamine-1-phosphate N-acetyltransferase GlmU [Pseudomonadota bacterium]
MNDRRLGAIVLAAGLGTRMRSDRPKVLHEIAGRPMIHHVMAMVEALGAHATAVVIGADMDAVAAAVAPHRTAVQAERRGTGHAVLAARALIDGAADDVVVLYGDVPLIRADTVRRLIAARSSGAALAVLGFRPADPSGYGRLILAPGGGLDRIVEQADLGPAEQTVALCNAGAVAADARRLFALLEQLRPNNAQGEYYLTDIVALARAAGDSVAVVEAAAEEVQGVNSRLDLSAVEAVAQRRLRHAAMAAGATLTDPDTVYFSADTRLGRDVTVGPNVVFGRGVTVGDRVEIRAFCHLEETRVADDALIGPFARLRPGAEIGVGAHIGNFVEIKNAVIEAGAKANHLSYVGDAHVGAGANIGAGTITCNYDGVYKWHTEIGARAFIGSNTALVAPVTIGADAMVGAGSVITADVPAGALAFNRAPPTEVADGVARFRERRVKFRERARDKQAKSQS